MYLTLTANAALDRLIFIPRFEFATTMRTERVVDAVGGKGYDVSVALRCLGQETTAVGFMAGSVGQHLASILTAYGICTDLVWVEGETRTAHVIIETDLHRHSHIITGGYRVDAGQLKTLFDLYSAYLPQASWVLASGSLPAGASSDFYATTARLALAQGVPVLVDTSGEPMRQAAQVRPSIVKLNGHEFASTFGSMLDAGGTDLQQARQVRQAYALPNLVITQGEKGILACTEQGDFRALGPQLQAVNAAGAGDVTSACLAWRLHLGETWREALKWAAAAGAAAVLTERTAECEWRVAQELFPSVQVISA